MVEELKQRLLHKPFTPFLIVMDSGERLDVTRFGQVAIGLTQFIYVSPDMKWKVHSKLDQIRALETVDEARAS